MIGMTDQRTDPHRPSALDPADYVRVGESDQAAYWGEKSFVYVNHNRLREFDVETDNHNIHSPDGVPWYDPTEDGRARYRCHHCGKHGENIRYFIFFLHKPTKKVIVVGKICAEKLNLGSKEELNVQKHAKEWRAQNEWRVQHETEVAFLSEYQEQRAAGGIFMEFFDSLNQQLAKYNKLTDRQVTGLRKWMTGKPPWQKEEPPNGDGDRHQGVVTRTQETPTEAQIDYLRNLCEQLGRSFDIVTADLETRIQASDLINELKIELRAKQPQEEPATSAQMRFINSLMDQRTLPIQSRREARAKIDAGLTKSQASRAIEWLQEFPEAS